MIPTAHYASAFPDALGPAGPQTKFSRQLLAMVIKPVGLVRLCFKLWNPHLLHLASPYARRLIALSNVVSIRVCQPGPVALKWSITSGERRRDTSFLVGVFCGPRLPLRTTLPLRTRSAWASHARAASAS